MPEFNEQEYWIGRHKELRGDPRSVGNQGRTVEENLEGQKSVRAHLTTVLDAAKLAGEDSSVLDLGCGIGLLAPLFRERKTTYTGVELSPDAVEQARQVAGDSEIIEHDMTTYHSPKRYDLVLASYVLVHLVEDTAWKKTLWNIAGAMKDEGTFLLIDHVPNERENPARHVVNRSQAEYKQALAEIGLEFASTSDVASLAKFTQNAYRCFFLINRLAQ